MKTRLYLVAVLYTALEISFAAPGAGELPGAVEDSERDVEGKVTLLRDGQLVPVNKSLFSWNLNFLDGIIPEWTNEPFMLFTSKYAAKILQGDDGTYSSVGLNLLNEIKDQMIMLIAKENAFLGKMTSTLQACSWTAQAWAVEANMKTVLGIDMLFGPSYWEELGKHAVVVTRHLSKEMRGKGSKAFRRTLDLVKAVWKMYSGGDESEGTLADIVIAADNLRKAFLDISRSANRFDKKVYSDFQQEFTHAMYLKLYVFNLQQGSDGSLKEPLESPAQALEKYLQTLAKEYVVDTLSKLHVRILKLEEQVLANGDSRHKIEWDIAAEGLKAISVGVREENFAKTMAALRSAAVKTEDKMNGIIAADLKSFYSTQVFKRLQGLSEEFRDRRLVATIDAVSTLMKKFDDRLKEASASNSDEENLLRVIDNLPLYMTASDHEKLVRFIAPGESENLIPVFVAPTLSRLGFSSRLNLGDWNFSEKDSTNDHVEKPNIPTFLYTPSHSVLHKPEVYVAEVTLPEAPLEKLHADQSSTNSGGTGASLDDSEMAAEIEANMYEQLREILEWRYEITVLDVELRWWNRTIRPVYNNVKSSVTPRPDERWWTGQRLSRVLEAHVPAGDGTETGSSVYSNTLDEEQLPRLAKEATAAVVDGLYRQKTSAGSNSGSNTAIRKSFIVTSNEWLTAAARLPSTTPTMDDDDDTHFQAGRATATYCVAKRENVTRLYIQQTLNRVSPLPKPRDVRSQETLGFPKNFQIHKKRQQTPFQSTKTMPCVGGDIYGKKLKLHYLGKEREVCSFSCNIPRHIYIPYPNT